MVASLYGSGKTTAAKTTRWFSKRGLPPAAIQTDTDRQGTCDQVRETAERAEVISTATPTPVTQGLLSYSSNNRY